jgi:hypothetical protein
VFEEAVGASPETYRARAKQMLQKASKAHTQAARAQYIALAEHWNKVAKFISFAAQH